MATKKDEAKIKFTAETSEFNQNVKNANKEMASLRDELRLNSAEMKNTGETTRQLKERHFLLQKELDANREKTKNLNLQLESAKKIYGEDSEEVAKLTRQLNTSKTAEQRIQTELDQTSKKLKTNAKNYGLSAEKAEKFNKVTSAISKTSAAVTTAVAGMAVAAVKEASTFEDAMAKVTTIAKDVDVDINGKTMSMRDAILELSNETGKDASVIAESVYSAISAGQDTADAVNFVSKSLKLAKSGFTEGEKATDLLTTALNAYNLEADKTAYVSDLLITTQNLGKTTVNELASTMGGVIPVAKSNNVALNQLCTGYAELTAKGITTNQATTLMKSLFQELGKDGSKSAKILKEETGKTFKELMSDGKSLSDVIAILNEHAKKNGTSLGNYFAKINASTAATSLLGDSTNEFNSILKKMNKSTGATDTAFGKMNTASSKANKALNKLKLSSIEVGTNILNELEPSMDDFFVKIDEGTKWIIENSDEIVDGMKVIGTTAAVVFSVNKIAQFGKSIGTIKTAISGAISGVKALAVARAAETVAVEAETVATKGLTIAQMATPWGLIAGLVGGLTVGLLACAIATKDNTSNLWKEDEATKALIDSTDKLVQEHENLQEEIKRNKEARDENIESAESENVQVDILWKKLKELNGVQKKTNAQKETMKSLVESLNELMPELNLKYDAEKDALNKSTKAIEKNIKAQQNLTLAKAARKNAEEVAGDITDAEIKSEELAEQKEKNKKELDKATKERKAAEKAWKEAEEYETNDLMDKYNDYQKALARENKLQKAYDDTSNAIKENQKTIDGLYSEYDKFTNYAENLFDKNEIEEKLNALTKKAKKAGVEIPKSISEGIESGKYAVPESIKQLNALIKYKDIIDKAEKAGIKIPKSVANGIKSGELKPSEAVERMNRWIDFKEAIEEAGLSGEKIPKKMRNGILKGTTSVESAISELKSKAVSKISGNGKEFKNQGKSDAQSYATGLKNGMPSDIYAAITPKIVLKTVGNSGSVKIQKNAAGNIVEKPILTTFAEEGPEAAIPINTSLRSRMLWLETGKRMGLLNEREVVSNYSNAATVDIQNKVDIAETNALLRVIASKDTNTYLNGRKISEGIASSLDTINGNRLMMSGKGYAYE